MAERKETREQTSEEKAHREAARAAGQQLGPRKIGGTIIEADGRVTYTLDGAVSATKGGPIDPTVQPDQFPENEDGPVKVIDRAEAPGGR